MSPYQSRRRFLQTAGLSSALLGADGLSFLSGLQSVSAAEARLDPKLVRLESGIEPVVRLLEETPRDRLLEEVGSKVRAGSVSYRELLAALLLAGVRNVQPRPQVGFKFHAVLVVNSAHLASLAAPENERWLPIFWALDNFKSSQAATIRESGWRLGPVDESRVPLGRVARTRFIEAMDSWDEPAADVAAAGLARTAGAHDLFELLCRYGARDFRDIGHKAIYVANAWRTLQCIGWHHAEPVVRSLAYALLQHEGSSPATRDAEPDRPGRANKARASRIHANWQEGTARSEATVELLAALRQSSSDEVCDRVVDLLNSGTAPQSIWDAFHLAAGELLMRQPGIVALHAVTSTNALHYAFRASGQDDTRRWLLLQNAAFLPLFRAAMIVRGKIGDTQIDHLEAETQQAQGTDAVGDIFRTVSSDRMTAARKVLAYRQHHGDPKAVMDAARLLVFFKGNDSHDYKFSSAVLEDYLAVSPSWRDRFLAAGMFQFRGAAAPDTAIAKRTQAALKG